MKHSWIIALAVGLWLVVPAMAQQVGAGDPEAWFCNRHCNLSEDWQVTSRDQLECYDSCLNALLRCEQQYPVCRYASELEKLVSATKTGYPFPPQAIPLMWVPDPVLRTENGLDDYIVFK